MSRLLQLPINRRMVDSSLDPSCHKRIPSYEREKLRDKRSQSMKYDFINKINSEEIKESTGRN